MPSIDIIDVEVKRKIDNSSSREYTFTPKDLKDIFPELKPEEDFSLIPLVDRITRMFMVDLKQNPKNYSVSSFRYAGKDGKIPHCHYFENGRIYDLGIGDSKHRGNISMNIHKIDINPVSNSNLSFSRRHYWMSDRITLKGSGHQTEVLHNLLINFIQRQNLEELIEQSRKEILETEAHRTETGFARPKEFHEFYFEDRIETKGEDIL